MDWLEKVFSDNEQLEKPRSLILGFHEFHGPNYFMGKYQNFWVPEYGDRFLGLLNKYQHRVSLISGGHIHHLEMRSQIAPEYPDINIPMIIGQSVSPIYFNNPGYTVLEFTDSYDQTTQTSS